ncbi:putative bifunctional diguanylate cyclase/phosphodiesterase [Paractinoplanes lichenicola]|uniref:EAL domain-containing protein n=1 Tax=Paractinoplanes lichenicola TaxID=2802976 RepID=A0ABS1VGH2_9ACTN|nr:EAL domain-containing protein [Actinoplanes lichenicola]MBL7253810.1 EAL domain-containing protein [Actinoplanes lichenicola]
MPARWAAALFGGWMAVLAVLFVLVPTGAQTPVRLLAGVTAVVVVTLGVRRNRPVHRFPWRMLTTALVLSVLGTAMFRAPDWAHVRLPGLDNVGSVLVLASYPVLAFMLVAFLRRRAGDPRDRAALLDSLTVTAGVALLSWSFVIGPNLQGAAAQTWQQVAFPLGDLLLVGMLARLLVSGATAWAGRVLGAGLAVMLISDVGYEMSLLGGPAYIVGLGRFALYTAAGLAALHPSMAELDRPAGLPVAQLGRGRLVLLGIASMTAPVVLLVRMVRDGEVPDLTVVAALSALTFLLVLVRMADIMAGHRRALGRERALREASAALVSAADTDQVSDAVRTAVAHLLPPDTPHAVVLAVTIVQDGPQSSEAAADRSTGTAARIMATRDVDWAVSVRLTNFPMTLRCPLVLADRPTGDPLLGVLHVAAPAPELPGLLRAIEVLATQAALALERIGLSQEVIRRNSETYFRTLVQKTSDVILIVDEEDRVRYASPSAAGVLGDDPTGFPLPAVMHPAERARLTEVLAALRTGEGPHEGLDFRALADVVLEMHGQDLRADPTVAALVITLRDVTERRRLEAELTHRVFHDAMTGLANRVLFHDRLGHALARGARDGSVVGVLFIDLDDFKKVNDTLGHAAGDQLLIGVADRIAGALRADDTAARLGGDEFAALVENVQDPGAVEETAQRILTALAEPIAMADGSELTAVASIGITTTPEADTADELLRQADLALYVAKGAGKNQWRPYQAHLHDSMVERLELRSALGHAVHEGHFLLAYQPVVDLRTDEAVGFEALVRWHHPTRGVIAPAEFLEVAEESGLVVPMGRWVLDQALHTVAQWWRTLPRSRRPYVSVNVSARQFRDGAFVEQVKQSLAYAGVPPQALMLELSENLLAAEHDAIWADLAALRELGVGIAIDDFGTGHSAPGDLRRRPLDVVKIDKTFLDDTALVTGLVALAQSLGLTVIAEGIEDVAHRDMLLRMGCPLGQGYLLSSPLDGTEALSRMTGSVGLPLVA